MRRSRLLLGLLVLAAAAANPASVLAAGSDADLPAGHFYTQVNGGAGPDYGFRIPDEDGIGFWSEFQRLGGTAMLGYPISRRFMLDGYMVQATQKVILQWRPDVSPPQAYFVNLFDKFHDLGLDGALQNTFQIPAPLDPAVFDQQTVGDGTFDFTIANGCPNFAINVSVWVLEPSGRQVSDVKTVYYNGNCYTSGEFHFDFVRSI